MSDIKQSKPDHPIHEFISKRWSPYAFSDRKVSEDDLKSLFEAARWAAVFLQRAAVELHRRDQGQRRGVRTIALVSGRGQPTLDQKCARLGHWVHEPQFQTQRQAQCGCGARPGNRQCVAYVRSDGAGAVRASDDRNPARQGARSLPGTARCGAEDGAGDRLSGRPERPARGVPRARPGGADKKVARRICVWRQVGTRIVTS